MSLSVRPAVADDVARLAALGAAHRRRLAGWSPTWWRTADAADEIHPLWLGHLVGDDGTVVRVVEDDAGVVVGGAVSLRQPEQWFVDDVVVVDDSAWPGPGVTLLRAIAERPALTCVPHADTARVRASAEAGLSLVSSYWMHPCGHGSVGGPVDRDRRPIPADADVPPAPRHSFGGTLDPWAEGALSFADRAGIVVGSPSIAAPPVYDPGGTVAVVDRIGEDRAALVRDVLAAAAERGDVLVAVVAAADDDALAGHLAAIGFDRTVDVYAWPDDGSLARVPSG